MCYVEWWDERLSKWQLSMIPLEAALGAVVMDPLRYHIVDESAIKFD